jgi:hypothetical protein
MLTKNNWYTSNISERFHNKTSSFDAYLNPYPFQEMSFVDACIFNTNELKKDFNNFYVALSGGLDSLFVTKELTKNGVDVCPIIVDCNNSEETQYAFELCDELNLKPVVIKKTESELFDYYYNYIHLPFAGLGYRTSFIMVAAEYVIGKNGTLITGNHLLGDGEEESNDVTYVNANEWDFYTDYSLKECNNVDFMLYTPELVYASRPKETINWDEHRKKLYGIERNKITPKLSDELLGKFLEYNRKIPFRIARKNWTKQEFFEVFDKVKL